MMRVRMLRAERLQDAGVERQLSVGQAYVLPDLVAAHLVTRGVAIEDVAMDVPESKAVAPVESKRRTR